MEIGKTDLSKEIGIHLIIYFFNHARGHLSLSQRKDDESTYWTRAIEPSLETTYLRGFRTEPIYTETKL